MKCSELPSQRFPETSAQHLQETWFQHCLKASECRWLHIGHFWYWCAEHYFLFLNGKLLVLTIHAQVILTVLPRKPTFKPAGDFEIWYQLYKNNIVETPLFHHTTFVNINRCQCFVSNSEFKNNSDVIC